MIETRKNIFIHDLDCPSFIDSVELDLDLIEKNPIGKRLIEKIGELSHKINIIHFSEGNYSGPINILNARTPGKGSSSIIWYSISKQTHHYLSFQCESIEETPRFVNLVHELIHGYHNGRGKKPNSIHCDQIAWSNDSEYKVIMGFPSKKIERAIPKITENAFRLAQGLQPRFSHHYFEYLNNNPVIYSHVKLLAKACYQNEFPLQINQMAIKNLIDEDLKPIGGAIIFWRVYFQNHKNSSHMMQYIPNSRLENFPTMTNFDPKLLSSYIDITNIYPSVVKVDSVGFYKISEADANWFLQQ